MVLVKLHRSVRKHFGGYRNFLIWILFVSTAVYIIDKFMLPVKHRKSPHRQANVQTDVSRIKHNNAFLIADEPPKQLSDDEDSENGRQRAQQVNEDHQDENKFNEFVNKEAQDGGKQNVHFEQGSEDRLTNCGVSGPCPHGSYSYMLRTGYQRNGSATICFNGEYLISASLKNNHRGMNIVLINEKTLNIDDIQVFDVYFTDIGLLEYMKENMQADQIVLIASQDEASYSLKSEGRKAIRELGSVLIDDVAFRDNYVLIGKRGIPSGRALEKMQARESGHEFAEPVQINGCLALPFERNEPLPVDRQRIHLEVEEAEVKEENAPPPPPPPTNKNNNVKVKANDVDKLVAVPSAHEQHPAAENSHVGELENCGLAAPCSADEIAVQLYTGRQNKDPPKICVDGKYVLAADLNGGGRGLNFVVINPRSKAVLHVAHFDTYSADNIAIEMFLEILNENDLVLGVAYDEASDKLELSTRDAIEALGSSFIKALSFRDVWAFVGRKGIKGYSPIEQISFSDASKTSLTWPKPINLKTCVPTELRPVKQQQRSQVNVKRRQFCQKHDGYGQFCNADVVDNIFKPLPHPDAAIGKHAIYQVPIIVVAGMDHNAVRLQLESLFLIVGLNPTVIRVLYDEKFAESQALAEVFDVLSLSLPGSVKYSDLLQKAIVKGWTLFPSSNYLIVLEEEVVPTSDFLNFLRQCFNSLNTDKTLIGISAWNPNGYPETSRDSGAAYRVQLFPGLGFILKRSFFEQYMEKNISECCSLRSWEGWMAGKLGGMEMIVPEVSRVSRGRFDGKASEQVKQMFKRTRLTIGSGELGVISDPDSLVEGKYASHIEKIIEKSVSLNGFGVETCLNKTSFYFDIQRTNSDSKAFVVYYDDKDYRLLSRLCNCFKLSGSLIQPGFGQHRHLLRFNQRGRIVFFVGSTSPYYRLKPTNVKPLTVGQIVS